MQVCIMISETSSQSVGYPSNPNLLGSSSLAEIYYCRFLAILPLLIHTRQLAQSPHPRIWLRKLGISRICCSAHKSQDSAQNVARPIHTRYQLAAQLT